MQAPQIGALLAPQDVCAGKFKEHRPTVAVLPGTAPARGQGAETQHIRSGRCLRARCEPGGKLFLQGAVTDPSFVPPSGHVYVQAGAAAVLSVGALLHHTLLLQLSSISIKPAETGLWKLLRACCPLSGQAETHSSSRRGKEPQDGAKHTHCRALAGPEKLMTK